MGIAFSFLEFFDICYRQQNLNSPMIALGALDINESEDAIRAFTAEHPYWNRDRARSVHSLFRDRYGVTDYRDCDLNAKADIQLDLNKPLALELIGSAMTILNGGTAEHAFDVAQTIVNMHDMARPGATIIHLSPISWYDHGYYNINPRLFAAVAKANQYCLVAEAFWLDMRTAARPHAHSSQARLGSFAQGLFWWLQGKLGQKESSQYAKVIRGLTGPILYITFDGQKYTPQRGVISARLLATDCLPANVLYMVAYQKTSSRGFVVPYDIHE